MKDYLRVLKLGMIDKKFTFLVFSLSILAVIFDALSPLALKLIFDFLEQQVRVGFKDFDPKNLYIFFLLYIVLIMAKSFFTLTGDFYSMKWWQRTRNRLASRVFEHLENLSASFFEKESTGKLIEKVSQGVNDLQNILDASITDIFPQVIFIIIAIFFLLKINSFFGLVIMIGIPIFLLISALFTKILNRYQDRVRDAAEKATTIRVETIGNIKTVKAFATEKRHLDALNRTLENLFKANVKRGKSRVKMNILRFSIVDGTQALIIILGSYWAATGKMTIGTLVMTWTYFSKSYGPLWSLTRIYDHIQRDMRSVKRVFDILDTKEEVQDINRAINLRSIRGDVEFQDVKFKYRNKNVINGLNLKISSGQVVAIVGKSGVGKSTLAKLLLRFYDPQEGNILVDGHNIREITQKSLRENIGVVLQDTAIFNDTAYNNIAYANPKASKNDVIKAAHIANAHDFVRDLPEGYDTMVGERGVRLSGGEQQRVNIARAVLKNPPILVLDEATSHLDSESEQLIQDALWKLIKGRTSIVIAHRLSTVMKADLIVVLDKGKISEVGTHDELVKHEGIYNKLFKIQSGSYLK